MAYNHLFSPIKIGNVEIPNRIALMPMGVLSPRMMNRDASYTKDGADYYIERAKGGTGLIITGMAPIPPGEFLLALPEVRHLLPFRMYGIPESCKER